MNMGNKPGKKSFFNGIFFDETDEWMSHAREHHDAAFQHGGMTSVHAGVICPCGHIHEGKLEESYKDVQAKLDAMKKAGKDHEGTVIIDTGNENIPDDQRSAASNHLAGGFKCGNCGRVHTVVVRSFVVSLPGDEFEKLAPRGVMEGMETSEGQASSKVEYHGKNAEMTTPPSTYSSAGGLFNTLPRPERSKLH